MSLELPLSLEGRKALLAYHESACVVISLPALPAIREVLPCGLSRRPGPDQFPKPNRIIKREQESELPSEHDADIDLEHLGTSQHLGASSQEALRPSSDMYVPDGGGQGHIKTIPSHEVPVGTSSVYREDLDRGVS